MLPPKESIKLVLLLVLWLNSCFVGQITFLFGLCYLIYKKIIAAKLNQREYNMLDTNEQSENENY